MKLRYLIAAAPKSLSPPQLRPVVVVVVVVVVVPAPVVVVVVVVVAPRRQLPREPVALGAVRAEVRDEARAGVAPGRGVAALVERPRREVPRPVEVARGGRRGRARALVDAAVVAAGAHDDARRVRRRVRPLAAYVRLQSMVRQLISQSCPRKKRCECAAASHTTPTAAV